MSGNSKDNSYEDEEHLEDDENDDVLISPPLPDSANLSEMEYSNLAENMSFELNQTAIADGGGNQMDETGDDPLSSPHEKDLFFIKGIFYLRLFRSQLRPKEFTKQDVSGNTIQEVLASIWQVAVNHVRREVVFRDAVPHWSEKVQPDMEDIDRFVTLQDKAKKKGYSIGDLKHRTLSKWRGKSINIYVYTYSTSVETNPQYQNVLRKLVTPEAPDRSGAHSTRDDSVLANELREQHRDLEGHFSSWLLWANLINSSAAHERDRLKQAEAPPVQLAKYFRWATVSEAARLQSVHRGMVVANTLNDGWMRGISEVKNDLALATKILQGAIQKMEALELRGQFGSELCTAMETTMRPEETELSTILSAEVTDCDDVDHI